MWLLFFVRKAFWQRRETIIVLFLFCVFRMEIEKLSTCFSLNWVSENRKENKKFLDSFDFYGFCYPHIYKEYNNEYIYVPISLPDCYLRAIHDIRTAICIRATHVPQLFLWVQFFSIIR
jgi:hypothetical protein